jgi:hypothetical protein
LLLGGLGVGLYLLFRGGFNLGSFLGSGLGGLFKDPFGAIGDGVWDAMTGGQWSAYQREKAIYDEQVKAQEIAQAEQSHALDKTNQYVSQGQVEGAVQAYQESVNARIRALEVAPAPLKEEHKEMILEQAEQGERRVERAANQAKGTWNNDQEIAYLNSEIERCQKDMDFYRSMYQSGHMSYEDYNYWYSLSQKSIDGYNSKIQELSTVTVSHEITHAATPSPPGESPSSPQEVITKVITGLAGTPENIKQVNGLPFVPPEQRTPVFTNVKNLAQAFGMTASKDNFNRIMLTGQVRGTSADADILANKLKALGYTVHRATGIWTLT